MTESTVVFNINLSDGSDRREWSYLELMQNHLAQVDSANDGNDASGNTAGDPQLTELAKSLERKYGPMVTIRKSGKRKRVRINDFLDIGEGYDTQDSFIDDSEAVDVYVAPSVSTKHGGFFVFEGALEALEDEAEIETPAGAKSTTSVARTVNKKNKSRELLEKAVKRLSASRQSPGAPRNKMRHMDSLFDSVLSSASSEIYSSSKSPDIPTIKSTDNSVANVSPKPTVADPQKSLDRQPASQKQSQPEKTKVAKEEAVPPPLPQSLSSDLISSVENLIKIGSVDGALPRRSTSKHFEVELLNLSNALKESGVSPSVRSIVFAHIEGVLQWNRKSLTRRLKKLIEASEDQKMNPLLDALSDAISRAMPTLLESYVRDKELHQERLKAWQAENIESADNPMINGDAPTPKRNPKPGAPKKLFRWNNECRQLFQSVVTLRLESYDRLNIKLPREEHLRGLFPTLIQLWPDGWITNTALWRAALPMFQKLTNTSLGGQTNGTVLPPVPPIATPTSHSGTANTSPGIVGTSTSDPCAVRNKAVIQSINHLPSRTASAPLGFPTVPVNVAPSSILLASSGDNAPTVYSSEAITCTTGAKLNVTLFAATAGDVPRSLQSHTLTHSIPSLRTNEETFGDACTKQHFPRSSLPAIQSSIKMSHDLKNRPSIIANRGSPRSSLISLTTGSALHHRLPASPVSSTRQVHVSTSISSDQVIMNSQLVNQSTPVSSGVFRLPSISTIAGFGSVKPAAAVSGKVIPLESNDSHRLSQFSHLRKQSEPLVVRPVNPAAQPGVRQFSQLHDPKNSASQNTVVSILKVADSHAQIISSSTNLLQSPAVALAAHHVDLQGTISSDSRSSSILNPALIVATTSLPHRQPPPAHQQSSVSHCYYQRLGDGFVGLVPSTHADLNSSGLIQTDTGRQESS